MTLMPEEGRQAAHVLLDMVSAFDPEDPDDGPSVSAMNLALQRLNDVGAVTATMDDETGALSLDISNLVGGAAVVVNWLVLLVAELSQRLPQSHSRHDVIVKVREFLDTSD